MAQLRAATARRTRLHRYWTTSNCNGPRPPAAARVGPRCAGEIPGYPFLEQLVHPLRNCLNLPGFGLCRYEKHSAESRNLVKNDGGVSVSVSQCRVPSGLPARRYLRGRLHRWSPVPAQETSWSSIAELPPSAHAHIISARISRAHPHKRDPVRCRGSSLLNLKDEPRNSGSPAEHSSPAR